MHSSGMRTGCSLTVCWHLLPGGGSARGGAWSRGGTWSRGDGLVPGDLLWGDLLGGICSGGWSGPGGLSQHAEPPPVDRHTPVKTLPWPNFVAAGKNV